MPEFEWLSCEKIDDGKIAIISLGGPRGPRGPRHGAVHLRGQLVELDAAFLAAEADDGVRVVILRGTADSFSFGEDLRSGTAPTENESGPEQHATFGHHGGSLGGIEQNWLQEQHFTVSKARRWRELRKITIASVEGGVTAGGLMPVWACDLIVADETAYFADPTASRTGVSGVAYFAHPWEWGSRRAKDLLLTGDSISADEAYEIGAINKVFATGTLEENTIAFARRAAKLPTATSMMVKEAVNQTQDTMGFHSALQGSFTLHELSHSHWGAVSAGESVVMTPGLSVDSGQADCTVGPPARQVGSS